MASRWQRTNGGVSCCAFGCSAGYYNYVEGQKKSLFNFPNASKDEARYVPFYGVILRQKVIYLHDMCLHVYISLCA